MVDIIKTLFLRDLNKLKKEIELYSSESILWVVDGNISNSGGNLCCHLIGNLKTYIGRELGNSNYVRRRDLEFSAKDIARAQLLIEIDETIQIIDRTLSLILDEDLGNDYPIIIFKEKMSIGYFLFHLATHLNYHLGQINYHRRLMDA